MFIENFLHHIKGEEMTDAFDGHANCFVESGDGKAMLIDFNYEVQPLPGKYPVPVVGPLLAVGGDRVNHSGSSCSSGSTGTHYSRDGRMPVPALMSMAGKKEPDES